MTTSLRFFFRTRQRSLVEAGGSATAAGKPPALRASVGQVVSDLGEPDEVAFGVFGFHRDQHPVFSRAIVMLPLDRTPGGHGLADLHRFGEFRIHDPDGTATLSDHSPLADHDGPEGRHGHHAVTARLGDAEYLCARG